MKIILHLFITFIKWLLVVIGEKIITDNLPSLKIDRTRIVSNFENFRVKAIEFGIQNQYSFNNFEYYFCRFYFSNLIFFIACCMGLALVSHYINANNPLALQLLGFRISFIFILTLITAFLPLPPKPTKPIK